VKENNRVRVCMRRYNRSRVNKIKNKKKFIVAMRGNCRAIYSTTVLTVDKKPEWAKGRLSTFDPYPEGGGGRAWGAGTNMSHPDPS
jgi:hypothetical protein